MSFNIQIELELGNDVQFSEGGKLKNQQQTGIRSQAPLVATLLFSFLKVLFLTAVFSQGFFLGGGVEGDAPKIASKRPFKGPLQEV